MSVASTDPQDPRTLTIHIMGREYQVACPPDEQDKLIASAEYLHDRMTTIRKNGRSMGIERIAVMAALNIARELLDQRDAPPARKPAAADSTDLVNGDVRSRLQQMELAIERALEAG